METGKSLPTPAETSSTDKDEAKDTKKASKKKGFEAFLPANRRREAEKIAESLDRSPLFAVPEKAKVEEAKDELVVDPESIVEPGEYLKNLPEIEDDEELSEDELSPEETQAIIQQIAAENYDTAEPVEAVRDFYHDLLDGETINEAYVAAQEQNELPDIEPNIVPTEVEINWRRAAGTKENWGQRDGFVAGVIVGELLGRRKGRLKNEKKTTTARNKLEKQVKQLQQEVSTREVLLRQATATKTDQLVENRQRPVPMAAAEIRKPTLTERLQPGRQETRLGLEKPARAERLGHMIVAAQTPEQVTKFVRPNNIRQAFRPEEVKTLPRRELLELSEKIVVEGASLRHIYESHLIGEKQLRHLVGEYLKGKNISRDLRKEMIEREIDFERDPILRDRVRSQLAASPATLNQMLAKAGALPGDDPETERRAKLQAARDQAKSTKQNRQRQAADAAMITLIVVLAIAVFLLLMKR